MHLVIKMAEKNVDSCLSILCHPHYS